MHTLWFFCISLAVIFSFFTHNTTATEAALFQGIEDAVSLAVRLMGLMAFWSGMMHILEKAGGVDVLGKILSPLTVRLFPKSTQNADTKKAITGNIASNILGLGNAATPFGLRAVSQMKSEKEIGRFVLLNTTGFCLLPTTVISILRAEGAANPGKVIPLIWATSFISLLFAMGIVTVCGGKAQ